MSCSPSRCSRGRVVEPWASRSAAPAGSPTITGAGGRSRSWVTGSTRPRSISPRLSSGVDAACSRRFERCVTASAARRSRGSWCASRRASPQARSRGAWIPSTLQRESAIRTLVEALRASERRRSELAHRSLPSAPTTFRHKDGRPSWVFEGPWIVEGPLVSLTIQDRTEAALLARKLTERCARKEER